MFNQFPGYGLLAILSAIPIYGIFIAWSKKPKCFRSFSGKYLCST